MNKFKTGILILFAIIIVILIFFLVKNINNNNENQENQKIISEIKFLDTKLTSLLNSVNNISLENYKISVTETSTNWDNIKNEIELLYSIIPTMTLDLYSVNVSQDEILGFNKELDELTMIVKEEDKGKTLIKLADLYRYLPVYASNASSDSEFISLLETKLNVVKAYVYVNLNNWDEAKSNTQKAIESYSSILNNINTKSSSYDTNKIYVILNELESSANAQDADVFLIKYKTFLKESENYIC